MKVKPVGSGPTKSTPPTEAFSVTDNAILQEAKEHLDALVSGDPEITEPNPTTNAPPSVNLSQEQAAFARMIEGVSKYKDIGTTFTHCTPEQLAELLADLPTTITKEPAR